MVAIGRDQELLALETNETTNTHASFVQVAIDKILTAQAIPIQSLDAIVVTMGPGSYTGLRVGLASAKGIAYAIQKPLIGISTLALLAKHAINNQTWMQTEKDIQIFSMIDAKRMEVFGAIYKADLSVSLPEQAIILETSLISKLLENGPLLCIGNGAPKVKDLIAAEAVHCVDAQYNMQDFMQLAQAKWSNKHFEDIAYSSPSYLKDFYQAAPKSGK